MTILNNDDDDDDGNEHYARMTTLNDCEEKGRKTKIEPNVVCARPISNKKKNSVHVRLSQQLGMFSTVRA